jgi:hypothetical protein
LEVNQITSLIYGTTSYSTGNSNLSLISQQTFAQRVLGYYAMNTLPFIIFNLNGWTNLPSLGGTPCPDYPISSSMPTINLVNSLYYANEGREYFLFHSTYRF